MTPWLYPDRYGRTTCDICDTVSHASIADHLAERHIDSAAMVSEEISEQGANALHETAADLHTECGHPFGPPWHDNREPGRKLPFGCEAVAS